MTWAHDPLALVTWVHNQRGTCIHDPIHVVLVTSVHDQVGTFDVLCITLKKKKKLGQNMALPCSSTHKDLFNCKIQNSMMKIKDCTSY